MTYALMPQCINVIVDLIVFERMNSIEHKSCAYRHYKEKRLNGGDSMIKGDPRRQRPLWGAVNATAE